MEPQNIEFTRLIRCWQHMPRTAGQAPRKAAFSPAKMARLLPYLYLIERKPEGGIVVRLTGNELEETLGEPGSSSRVFEAMLSHSRDLWEDIMIECGQHICAARMVRTVTGPNGLRTTIEAMQVPLADAEGQARFMLGVMLVKPFSQSTSHISDYCRASDPRITDNGAGISRAQVPPKKTLLTYQYQDLGCGVPSRFEKGLAGSLAKGLAVKGQVRDFGRGFSAPISLRYGKGVSMPLQVVPPQFLARAGVWPARISVKRPVGFHVEEGAGFQGWSASLSQNGDTRRH